MKPNIINLFARRTNPCVVVENALLMANEALTDWLEDGCRR